MRTSGRSNVVTWLGPKAVGVRSLVAVNPAAFPFCAVCLAMPFATLSNRLDGLNAQIVSDQTVRNTRGSVKARKVFNHKIFYRRQRRKRRFFGTNPTARVAYRRCLSL